VKKEAGFKRRISITAYISKTNNKKSFISLIIKRKEKGVIIKYIKVVEKKRTSINKKYILFISID
jgi:hypothetical protein